MPHWAAKMYFAAASAWWLETATAGATINLQSGPTMLNSQQWAKARRRGLQDHTRTCNHSFREHGRERQCGPRHRGLEIAVEQQRVSSTL